jgi:hypothetical protein
MYALVGFDLTAHSFNCLGGRRRRFHYVDHAVRAIDWKCYGNKI